MLKILLVILIALLVYYAITYFRQKKYLNILTQEEFIDGYRKAQLIDVREQKEFDRGHIRGARNIPLTQLKQSIQALRADKPVYLYCQNTSRSYRAAQLLHKNKFDNINVLKGGFKKWTGKIDYKK
ncbi:MAG TPA: rhodanese-like domain-containing protein [Pseudogracilibacillus sp.]|nr:rhodanese-like domain-containing protein [Pseudogracilibacillus sp.]